MCPFPDMLHCYWLCGCMARASAPRQVCLHCALFSTAGNHYFKVPAIERTKFQSAAACMLLPKRLNKIAEFYSTKLKQRFLGYTTQQAIKRANSLQARSHWTAPGSIQLTHLSIKASVPLTENLNKIQMDGLYTQIHPLHKFLWRRRLCT